MILRRVTEHVKAQNWFAVGLDFLIVVFGVFIGLQVQQSVVESERRANERSYLLRLHGEVEQLSELRQRYDKTRPRILSEVLTAIEILGSEPERADLTDFQCKTFIWVSSYYLTIPPDELPTITELLSAGQLDTISSEPVRQSVLTYIQEAGRARDLIVAVRGSNIQLSTKYPELIEFDLEPANGEDVLDVRTGSTCNTEGMRRSRQFMNEVNALALNYKDYTMRGVLPVSDRLEALHSALDEALGIQHSLSEGTID